MTPSLDTVVLGMNVTFLFANVILYFLHSLFLWLAIGKSMLSFSLCLFFLCPERGREAEVQAWESG